MLGSRAGVRLIHGALAVGQRGAVSGAKSGLGARYPGFSWAGDTLGVCLRFLGDLLPRSRLRPPSGDVFRLCAQRRSSLRGNFCGLGAWSISFETSTVLQGADAVGRAAVRFGASGARQRDRCLAAELACRLRPPSRPLLTSFEVSPRSDAGGSADVRI